MSQDHAKQATSSGTVTSITQGTGIQNTPNPITSSGTVALDINGLTTEPGLADNDLFPFLDVSVGTAPTAQRKIALSDLRSFVDAFFKRTAWVQQTDTANSFTSTSMGTNGTSGVSSVVTDATGAYLNYVTSAGPNTNAGWLGPTPHTQRQLLPDSSWVIKTGAVGADITVLRMWIGLTDATAPSPMNTDDPAGVNQMAFRFSTAAGDTTWQCTTKDGTTQGVTNSGITVASNTRYEMRIDASDGTQVKFFINGVLVATRSTNLPTNTANLQMIAQLRTLEAAVKNLRVRRYFIRDL